MKDKERDRVQRYYDRLLLAADITDHKRINALSPEYTKTHISWFICSLIWLVGCFGLAAL